MDIFTRWLLIRDPNWEYTQDNPGNLHKIIPPMNILFINTIFEAEKISEIFGTYIDNGN